MRAYRGIGCALAFTCASFVAAPAFAINIVFNPGATLSANPAAMAAFHRAAAQWESRLSDPITVTLDVDIAPMTSGTAGTTSVLIIGTFNNIRNRMVTDALDEGPDNLIVASLPTYSTFTATLPAGSSLNGGMQITKANLKAIGATGLDTQFGASDASINFNSNSSFDYDNSDGVGAGRKDFESAAIHEIGHALGFNSVAGASGTILPFPLDLFRFQNGAADVDPTAATFATTPRSLVTGGSPIFDDGTNEWAMSSGTDGFFTSHWKADELTGNYVGVMDPSLPFGQTMSITNADLRVFDLIGYELVTVPEPASLIALTLGAVGLRRRRSRSPS